MNALAVEHLEIAAQLMLDANRIARERRLDPCDLLLAIEHCARHSREEVDELIPQINVELRREIVRHADEIDQQVRDRE